MAARFNCYELQHHVYTLENASLLEFNRCSPRDPSPYRCTLGRIVFQRRKPVTESDTRPIKTRNCGQMAIVSRPVIIVKLLQYFALVRSVRRFIALRFVRVEITNFLFFFFFSSSTKKKGKITFLCFARFWNTQDIR